jgi:V-type H+-transporting ATPase 16kDa proteolipid subunit
MSSLCPTYAYVLGYLGVTMSCVFGVVGSSLGIVLISPPLLTLSISQPKLLTKCLMPIVMSGVVAVYGLIVSVVLLGSIPSPIADESAADGVGLTYSLYSSLTHLFAGTLCGLTAAAAGWCIGIVGRAFVGTLCWHTGGAEVKMSIGRGAVNERR